MIIPSKKYNMKLDIKKWFQEYKNRYAEFKKLKKKDIRVMKKLKENKQNKSKLFHIVKLNTNLDNKQHIFNEYKRFENLSTTDDEYPKLKAWIDWSLRLPFDNVMHFTHSEKNFQVSFKMCIINSTKNYMECKK